MTDTNTIPQFAIIVGAMKSGTTYLFSLLEQHPEIVACKVKEPEYFVIDYYKNNGLEDYYKLWDFDHGKHKYALEASTSYTKMPQFANAAENIKSSGINAKIIYMMRHPIERIRSQIQISRCFDWEVFDDKGKISNNAIAISKYHYQISEYYKRFPADQILLLSFEMFVDKPRATLQQVCEFLEIDNSFNFRLKDGNKHDGIIYFYQDTEVVRKIFGIHSYNDYLSYITQSENTFKKRLLVKYLTKIGRLKPSQIKPVEDEIWEDIERLRIKFGFSISS